MIVSIIQYGASIVQEDNTAAIQETINYVSSQGGGEVHVPEGIFLTGKIRLESNVFLVLEDGAVLQGKDSDSMVMAEGVSDSGIQGSGELRWNDGVIVPKAGGEGRWGMTFRKCSRIEISGIRVRGGSGGLLLDECEDVLVHHVSIFSSGDSFSIKSERGNPSSQIRLQNSELKSDTGGIKIGSESKGVIEKIEVSHVRILSSWVGISLLMKDGGRFRKISFADMEISTKAPFALVVDHTPRFYQNPTLGEVEGLEFRNLVFSGPGRMIVEGHEGYPIRNIRAENLTFHHTGKVDLHEARKPEGSENVDLDPDRDIHANRPYFIIGSRMEDFRFSKISITDRVGRLPDGIGYLYLHGCQAGNVEIYGNSRKGAASHLFEDVSGVSFVLNGHAVTRVAENPGHRFSKESMSWVWTDDETPERNAYVGFRKTVHLESGERARLRVTADSRYVLWVNGNRLGIGPPRAWPAHWEVDEYDLKDVCREGENLIAILVIHYGEGTMQYIPDSPGMAAAITIRNGQREAVRTLYSDDSWQARVCQGFVSKAPRMCLQMAFEERYDARKEAEWWLPGEGGEDEWRSALPIPAPHPRLRAREIPLLDSEEWFPSQIDCFQRVRSTSSHWTLNLRPYCCPQNTLSVPIIYKAFLFTQIYSPSDQSIHFIRPHWYHQGPMFLNGLEIPRLPDGFARSAESQTGNLVKGWNRLLIPLPDYRMVDEEAQFGFSLFPQFSMDVDTEEPVTWSANGTNERDPGSADSPWAFVGPFSYSQEEEAELRDRIHNFVVASPGWFPKGSTAENGIRIFKDVNSYPPGEAMDAVSWYSRYGGMYRPMEENSVLSDDVFLQCLSDVVLEDFDPPYAPLLKEGFFREWEIPASTGSESMRFLVDFGNMVVGDHEIELTAPEGTVIDVHNFEFIQNNGRKNYAEGMNNTFRYICREGRQCYRSIVRRGFRYSWITVRHASVPVRFHQIRAHFVAYPQKAVGSFYCNDASLNRIWDVGAHTLRCCAEDTYTDCPTYEQVFWVGDARNEALIDWMINGDNRLWYRCLRLTGESLERSAIVESHLPSADRSILPAWIFLWMRSCREYLLYSGDFPGAKELFRFIRRNFEGIRQCLNENDLYEIQAWNMFDWAEMDTPDEGVVTHNNCFLVLALKDTAELADLLEEAHWAEVFRDQASKVKQAINLHLWDDDEGAYVDSIHKDGKRSSVFSQQTQAVAIRADIPEIEERLKSCRNHVFFPPEHFVKSGSPFFQFFVLEILAREKQAMQMLNSIREHWGFMIDEGACTFWEMWSLRTGRLTRSHCHGWSAAPTYFLSTEVLGIHPLAPGFSKIRFSPRMGDLESASGVVPTPHGLIKVELHQTEGVVNGKIEVPDGVEILEVIGVELNVQPVR